MKFKHFLLQNHSANFNQTWQKASLDEGNSSLTNEYPSRFPRGDNYEISKIHFPSLKIVFWGNIWSIWTKLGTKHPCVKGTQGFSNKDFPIIKKEMMGFYSTNQCYDRSIALSIWTGFSGERCGQWACWFCRSSLNVSELQRSNTYNSVFYRNLCDKQAQSCRKFRRDKYRTANGLCNNLQNPKWGTPHRAHARYLHPEYDDGINIFSLFYLKHIYSSLL